MSEIPKEFKWIKPGAKAHHCLLGRQIDVVGVPEPWESNKSLWVVSVDGGSVQRCQDLIPVDISPISISLTREQAIDLVKYEDIPMYLFEKLQEKLNAI